MYLVQLVEQGGRIYRGVEADTLEEARELIENEEFDEYDPIENLSEEFRVYKDRETFEDDPGDYEDA